MLVLGTPAGASERSEQLVARGQAAYQAGRFSDASRLFADATAADPKDPQAQYALGLALGKLRRWAHARAALERAVALDPGLNAAQRALGTVEYHLGREALARGEWARAAELLDHAAARSPAVAAPARRLAASARQHAESRETLSTRKRWGLRASTGVEFDSNPGLAPHGSSLGKDQAGFLFGAGGYFDVFASRDTLMRLDYDFYQTLYTDFSELNFRSNSVAGTGSRALTPWLWGGVQAGYNHYAVDSHAYMWEGFVLPFLTASLGDHGTTQLLYRFGDREYLDAPFRTVRSGPVNTVGLHHRLDLAGQPRWLSVGYEFGTDIPRNSAGDDYAHISNGASLGAGFELGWDVDGSFTYFYRNDDYTEPNSVVDFRYSRDDNEHRFNLEAVRPFGDHVRVRLDYYGTINTSNIDLFDYRRQIVSMLFEVTY